MINHAKTSMPPGGWELLLLLTLVVPRATAQFEFIYPFRNINDTDALFYGRFDVTRGARNGDHILITASDNAQIAPPGLFASLTNDSGITWQPRVLVDEGHEDDSQCPDNGFSESPCFAQQQRPMFTVEAGRDGGEFMVVYVGRCKSLYSTMTRNGGLNWTDPVVVSLENRTWPEEEYQFGVNWCRQVCSVWEGLSFSGTGQSGSFLLSWSSRKRCTYRTPPQSGWSGRTLRHDVFLLVTDDHGKNWKAVETGFELDRAPRANNRAVIQRGAEDGEILLVGMKNDTLFSMRTMDGGDEWSKAEQVFSSYLKDPLYVVLAAGTIKDEYVVAWREFFSEGPFTFTTLYATRTKDGGTTWAQPTTITTVDVTNFNANNAILQLSIAAGVNPNEYVMTWTQRNDVESVYFTGACRSVDGGATWSLPIQLITPPSEISFHDGTKVVAGHGEGEYLAFRRFNFQSNVGMVAIDVVPATPPPSKSPIPTGVPTTTFAPSYIPSVYPSVAPSSPPPTVRPSIVPSPVPSDVPSQGPSRTETTRSSPDSGGSQRRFGFPFQLFLFEGAILLSVTMLVF